MRFFVLYIFLGGLFGGCAAIESTSPVEDYRADMRYTRCLAAQSPDLSPFQSRVSEVLSGDSMYVNHQGEFLLVKLRGVICPRNRQPFGKEAKSFTKRLTANEVVFVIPRGFVGEGVIEADVALPSKRLLGDSLLREGYAWCEPETNHFNVELVWLEREARSARRGLWREKNPVPPWQWGGGVKKENALAFLQSY